MCACSSHSSTDNDRIQQLIDQRLREKENENKNNIAENGETDELMEEISLDTGKVEIPVRPTSVLQSEDSGSLNAHEQSEDSLFRRKKSSQSSAQPHPERVLSEVQTRKAAAAAGANYRSQAQADPGKIPTSSRRPASNVGRYPHAILARPLEGEEGPEREADQFRQELDRKYKQCLERRKKERSDSKKRGRSATRAACCKTKTRAQGSAKRFAPASVVTTCSTRNKEPVSEKCCGTKCRSGTNPGRLTVNRGNMDRLLELVGEHATQCQKFADVLRSEGLYY